MYRLAAALTKVRNNLSDAYIADVGDDLKVSLNVAETNARSKSYPKILADQLRSQGYRVNDDALIGDKNLRPRNITDYSVYDSRVTAGTGWELTQHAPSFRVGGNPFIGVSHTSFSYTPSLPFNAVDIVFNTYSDAGACDVTIDGTVLDSNLSLTTATDGLLLKRYTLSNLSIHTISLKQNASTNTYISFSAILPRNTSVKQIYIHTFAALGDMARIWGGVINFLDTVNPAYCATIISLGMNDVLNLVPLVDFKPELKNKIDHFKSKGLGDIMLQTQPWMDTQLDQSSYTDQLYVLARTDQMPFNEYPVVELHLVSGGFADAYANGYMSDAKLWSPKGYLLMARETAVALIKYSGVS